MISPQKHSNGASSPRTSVPLRGLFLDGTWRCNCPERPPAAKLQTKNHGINHGRWFYICQHPQQNRCNFFLWASDAEAREKAAILANSRSEPRSAPQTPTKTFRNGGTGLLTPQTDRPPRNVAASASRNLQAPSKSAKARMMSEDSDEFGWDDTIPDEVTSFMDKPRQPDFGLADSDPRKAPRTDSFTFPGNRKLASMDDDGTITPTSVWSPRSSAPHLPPPSAEISMTPTPSKYKNVLSADSGANVSELSLHVLNILESYNVVVPRRAQEELTELLNRHDLKTKGISRGRDISRIAIKKKDEQIVQLNERIAALESQRELNRSMNSGLRR
ncbi:hypothetical protein BBP40_007420 [Aspergillus hancockii]|nr:hypothetical protein BBP40_007420 [Aspergillus hancockii]